MSDRESLTEVLKIACDRWARAHWLGCMPARVERFDPATNEIDAKPIIRDPHVDIEGTVTLENLPVIPGVPLIQFGAGGMRITFPVEIGDTVLLVFCRRSLDKWKARGGNDVDPGDARVYHYSDAVAIPGILPFSAPWTGVDPDAMTLGKDGGIQIHVTASEILLGGAGSTQAVIKGTAFKSAFDSWRSALNTYLGAIATAVNGLTGGALIPNTATYLAAETAFAAALSTVLSTEVKVNP